MNFMNRAWLYIIRKRGKSILLFIVLLVMATFVLTALALGNASASAQQNLRKSLGGEFLIECDYREDNPYLKKEESANGFIMYSTQQLSPKIVEQIRMIEGIELCSATVELLATCPTLKLFIGNIPIDEEFRQSTKIVGVWKSDETTLFTSGQLTLVKGRHLTPEDKMKAIISKDLADKNGLQIGDTIQTAEGATFEIVGLFQPKEIEGINVQVTSYDKIQNLIISDLSTVVAIEDSPAIQGFQELKVSISDPQDMENIISKVQAIKDIDWNGFTITADNDSFESASSSLQQLSSLVSTFLIIILIVSVAILSLILTMWARNRIHETGVLLSIGIRKLSILGQYITEVLLVAIIAFSLSYFSSSAIANQVGSILHTNQAANSNTQTDETGGSAASRGGATTSIMDQTQKTETPNLQVKIQLEQLGLLFLIGIGIATVSAGIASISVMRLKPRQILSKMS